MLIFQTNKENSDGNSYHKQESVNPETEDAPTKCVVSRKTCNVKCKIVDIDFDVVRDSAVTQSGPWK